MDKNSHSSRFCLLLKYFVYGIFFISVLYMKSRRDWDSYVGDNSDFNFGSVEDNARLLSSKNTSHLHQVVPNVVHLIWFYPTGTSFRFHQLLSLMSAKIHLEPRRILLWYTNEPTGPWWTFAQKAVPDLGLVRYSPPQQIFNQSVDILEHKSDIARLDILLKHGGIYLDLDVITIRNFDPLRYHTTVLGAETPNLLGSGVILAAPNSTFLHLWRDAYRNYVPSQWNYNSVIVPMRIAKANPNFVYIDWFRIHRPNWFERDYLYSVTKLWDWSDNYAVHLWYRSHNVDYDPVSIRTLNSTVGEIFRFIYYGNASTLT